MDIMMRLKGAGFSMIANEFRQREKRLGTGLPLQDFVEIVLQGLPKSVTPEEKFANVNALVDLFEAMDINGDGTMEFDEFTSYCVDAGMIATRNQATNLKHRYVRNTKHVIKTMNGAMGVEKVRWSPLLKRFLVLENAAKSVKLFNLDGVLVGEVCVQSASICIPLAGAGSPVSSHANEKSHRFGGVENDDSSPTKRSSAPNEATPRPNNSSGSSSNNSGIFILDATFLHRFQCLAMSTTDFVISFYNMEEPKHQQLRQLASSIHASGPTYELLPKLTITTTNAQLILRFCEQAGLLLSAGNDFIVNVWKITDVETKVLWRRLVQHQDMIMDILEIPAHDMIASCDLHHTIQLWDIHDCRSRGALVGHTRGIKQMVYSSDHDLLLTAGFEFEAYGWDIASRQAVMKLVGHRAPLIGVQLAMFQTERAVTGDASGCFKVWDISRTSGSSGGGAASGSSAGGARARGATHALLLESLDPSQQLSRFEPTTFVCLHPLSRDLWAAASGSATLHLFRSTRVQQFDEIPLRAFYNYTANRFVVVCGPVCSIWDGATGTCLDECTHVGGGSRRRQQRSQSSQPELPSSSHNGVDNSGSQSMLEASATDVLLCVQDAKCNKLVVVAEDGELAVFNSQNLMQMRRCEESFVGGVSSKSCGIVGVHYCTENKLVVMTDSHHSAILVVDDSNNDAAKGVRETQVLRRLVHVPGGIAASAYGYHTSLVATVDEATGRVISLWDFETLSFVAQCELEEEEEEEEGDTGNRFTLLEFWDEFPVLLATDLRGCVYLYAVMTTKAAAMGKLLHAFVNEDRAEAATAAEPPATTTDKPPTFLTEATESAARKFLMKKRLTVKPKQSEAAPVSRKGTVVTCMRVMYEDAEGDGGGGEENSGGGGGGRYLLFTGDEKGVVRVWDLGQMLRRLSLFKIPESHCKYLRRGYHPRAMFARDFIKETAMKRSGPLDVDPAVELGVLSHSSPVRKATAKPTLRTTNSKKKATTSSLAKLLAPNRLQPGHAPPAASSVAAAEAFLVHQSSTLISGGALINSRGKPASDRRRSLCWQHGDVSVLYSWTAHGDGLTSLEVSTHPNILVTCALDMRVFVWDWRGACLGKLFDAENLGACRWQFQRDDATRRKEREALVREVLEELELPAQAKAQRRRQTLYASHVQRASQHALRHVSVMLLEHIVSQHPEVAAMEKAQGLSGAEASRLTDQKINDEMEKRSRRNYTAKRRMLATLAQFAEEEGGGGGGESGGEGSNRQAAARMHSLAQVGPLLCVDKFESKSELEQMRFPEQEELAMDRQYLEKELDIGGLPKGTSPGQRRKSSGSSSSLASIRTQIQSTQAQAEQMLENKAALRRHATAMYVNLHRAKGRGAEEGRSAQGGDQDETEAMLEPSPFLKSQLPSHVLALRPQTAPKGLSRSASTSAIKRQVLRPLTASASSATVAGPETHRRSSLDVLYVEELQRQQQRTRSPAKRSVVEEENPAAEGSGAEGLDLDPIKKLDAINDIIARCSTPSSGARPQTAPSPLPSSSNSTDSRTCRASKSTLPTLREGGSSSSMLPSPRIQEEEAARLRAHMETTQRRMDSAMHDDEPRPSSSSSSSSHRSAASVRQREKHKRMHDYLQQKRREMNTNIGAVFKRTSFAFPMAGANAATTEESKGRLISSSSTSLRQQRLVQEAQTKVDKSKVFGIYGVKEVMSILRLFASMDEDGSGVLTLQELLAYSAYFEKLGYHDMATVFQAIDRDGSGSITLRELLEVCFPYATKAQVEEMLKLARLGDIAAYFDASRSGKRRGRSAGSEKRSGERGGERSEEPPSSAAQPTLTAEERAELLGIFHVFDRNGDGGVSVEEILEALHIEEDEVLARVEAAEEAQLALRQQQSGRRMSVAPSPSPFSSSAPSSTKGGLTKADVRKLYQDFDVNGDKTLNFEEFIQLMQTIYGR